MIKKITSEPIVNKFGVEPRDWTADQRCELFEEYKASMPNGGSDLYDDPPRDTPVKAGVEGDDEF
jgi:hypothetical protein